MRCRQDLGQGFLQESTPPRRTHQKYRGLRLGGAQELAMAELKDTVAKAPCLHPINYLSLLTVILAGDSSYIALGFVIYQMGADKKRYPNWFGSITWNDRESRYSQAKLEIYGLWRALRAVWIHIIGVKNLVVKVDAQYIKGMLNNPDIQPNGAVNRWIVSIKLFDFTLVHVPPEKHAAADGMSRWRRAPEDSDEKDDEESADEWLDKMMSFSVELVNSRPQSTVKSRVASGIPGHHVGVPYLTPRVGATPSTVYAVYFGTQEDDEDDTAAIPLSTKALEDEERLHKIKMLLNDPLAYKDFGSKELKTLVYQPSKFFILDRALMQRDRQGRHKVVPDPIRQLGLLRKAHDDLGHRGIFTTLINVKERFWWPMINTDIRWFVSTCHTCQTCQLITVRIPPVIADIPTLFRKVHIDCMLMPVSNRKRYIVHARCALTSWPEW
jgi:hypothetical protein